MRIASRNSIALAVGRTVRQRVSNSRNVAQESIRMSGEHWGRLPSLHVYGTELKFAYVCFDVDLGGKSVEKGALPSETQFVCKLKPKKSGSPRGKQ